MKVQETEIVV